MKKKQNTTKASGVSGARDYLDSADNREVNKLYKNRELDSQWFMESDEDIAESIYDTVLTIEQAQSSRRAQWLGYCEMYGSFNGYLNSHMGFRTGASTNAFHDRNNRVSLNIVQACIDTIAAKIAKSKPAVSFITSGADDYFLRLRAQKLTDYIKGIFAGVDLYNKSNQTFMNAAITGTGYMRFFTQDGKVCAEPVFYDCVRVDEIDGLMGKPRSMHVLSFVPRDELLIRYPEHREEIINADKMQNASYRTVVDTVRVVESIHLATSNTSKNGKRVVSIDGAALEIDDYTKDYFPVVSYKLYDSQLGFFGMSITEKIHSIQVEIYELLEQISRALELVAVPVILLDNDSQVAEECLTSNEIARIINYASGTNPPTFITPQALSSEVYEHLERLIQLAYETVGISQESASGQKPVGLESSVAIQTAMDISSERWSLVAERWERFFKECALVAQDMSRDLFLENKDLKVNYFDNRSKSYCQIDWKAADLKDNPFDIKVYPVSSLPDTPAAKLDFVSSLSQMGWVSQSNAMQMMAFDPDIEAQIKNQTASSRLVQKRLSEMVENGTYTHPEDYMNLDEAQQITQGVVMELEINNCPDDRIDLVRQFLNEVIAKNKAKQLAMQPPPQQGAPQQPPQQ